MESVSKVISDVIHDFYMINDIKFDFIIYGNKTNHINDVINGIKLEIPTIIKHIPEIKNWNHKLNQSAIFFLNSTKELHQLHEYSVMKYFFSQFTNVEPKKFKFFIYIEQSASFKDVESIVQKFPHISITILYDLTFHEFLIFNDDKEIILTANVFYTEEKCAKIQLKKLNSFDKIAQKWDKKLENFDHFANFYGCMLNFFLLYKFTFYTKDKKFNNLNDYSNFDGILNTLLNIMSVKHNFTIHYTILPADSKNFIRLETKNYNASLLYMIIFGAELKGNYIKFDTFYSQAVFPVESYFLISYNDLYTNYEKLSFPFDITTWILLIISFGLTFGLIFILRFFPKWLRTIIFGQGINNPGYNALGIFFGISQLRLPRENFGRINFILFIWFCLIIRTCWQSKMFEFTTTDMHKPLPESIEDLIAMNYSVALLDMNYSSMLLEEISNGRNGPQRKRFSSNEIFSTYKQALEGKIKSKYAFLVTNLDHAVWNSSLKNSLPIMKNEKLTKQYALVMQRNEMTYHHVNEIVDILLPSGILQHQVDYDLWYLHRPVDVKVEDSKRVLSMSDLEFGFVIFFGALSLTIFVFICELLSLKVKRQMRKLVGLYEFVKVIRERLKDYHDKW